jgi:hypothetical protein
MIRHKEKTTPRSLKTTHRRNTLPGKDHLADLRYVAKPFASFTSNSWASSSIMAFNIAIQAGRITGRHLRIGTGSLSSDRVTSRSRGDHFLSALLSTPRRGLPAIPRVLGS